MVGILSFLGGLLLGLVLSLALKRRATRALRAERDELRRRLLTTEMRRMITEKALEGAVEAYDQISSENEGLREDKLNGWGVPRQI